MTYPVSGVQTRLAVYDPADSPITVDLLAGVVALPDPANSVTSGTYNQHGYSWPDNPAIGPFGATGPASGTGNGLILPAGFTVQSLGTCHATENQDGSGTGYDLTAVTEVGAPLAVGPGVSGTYYANGIEVGILNPTGRTLYASTMTATGWRMYYVSVSTAVTPPVQPPSGTPPPSNLPPAVVQRKLLEKANPGFICELTRLEHYEDFGGVQLGQKANLTAPMVGMASRAHVITIIKHDVVAQVMGDGISWTLESRYTLEKIPGTLLPGAGTSTPAQDAAGTGGVISLYGQWDTAGGGWAQGGWAA